MNQNNPSTHAEEKFSVVTNSDKSCDIRTSGRCSVIGNVGASVCINNSGAFSYISSSGVNSSIINRSEGVQISVASDNSHIENTGKACYISSSGDRSEVINTGQSSKISCLGANSNVLNSGAFAEIYIGGYQSSVDSYAESVFIHCTCFFARVESRGRNAVITMVKGGIFKAGEGSTVSVSVTKSGKPQFIQGYVGDDLKADVWYTVNFNGDFEELESED